MMEPSLDACQSGGQGPSGTSRWIDTAQRDRTGALSQIEETIPVVCASSRARQQQQEIVLNDELLCFRRQPSVGPQQAMPRQIVARPQADPGGLGAWSQNAAFQQSKGEGFLTRALKRIG